MGSEGWPEYCEAALPVPLDKSFTYAVPEGLCNQVLPGCRVRVSLLGRTVTGVVLEVHRAKPDFDVLPIRKLLDVTPALDAELIDLGRWVARYYCTPVGEVFKAMLPLGGESRRKTVLALTPVGARTIEESLLPTSVETAVLESLRRRPLTLQYLIRKHRDAAKAIKRLRQRGLVQFSETLEERDPTMARGVDLRVEAGSRKSAPERPKAGERWLLDYLQRNPGSHDLRDLAAQRADVKTVARRLAKTGAVRLEPVERPRETARQFREHSLSDAQRKALETIKSQLATRRFQTFLLHGVTGSGKTEVYLRAAEEALSRGRSLLLLMPEIALTPASAGQFFARFGDRVAVLHSALGDKQRSDQWRRIRDGCATAVLGTRSAVFAPLKNLGLVIVDEEHDGSYKQAEAPRYNGRDVAIMRGRAAGATVVVGSGDSRSRDTL